VLKSGKEFVEVFDPSLCENWESFTSSHNSRVLDSSFARFGKRREYEQPTSTFQDKNELHTRRAVMKTGGKEKRAQIFEELSTNIYDLRSV
jgi:hypothetical protein